MDIESTQDFIEYNFIDDTKIKTSNPKSRSIRVRSHPITHGLNIIDFVGLDILGIDDLTILQNTFKKIARGMYPTNGEAFDEYKNYQAISSNVPDLVYWVIDIPSLPLAQPNFRNVFDRIAKIYDLLMHSFDHENIFIIFNKMDYFLNQKIVKEDTSYFNLTQENLNDIDFSLQDFTVEQGPPVIIDGQEEDIGPTQEEEINFFNNLFNHWKNNSYKIWCVNNLEWPKSRGYKKILNEARKILLHSLKRIK